MSTMSRASTSDIVRMLLRSFAENDGVQNFGFMLSMYEWSEEDDGFITETIAIAENDAAANILFEEIKTLHKNITSRDNNDNGAPDIDGDYPFYLN